VRDPSRLLELQGAYGLLGQAGSPTFVQRHALARRREAPGSVETCAIDLPPARVIAGWQHRISTGYLRSIHQSLEHGAALVVGDGSARETHEGCVDVVRRNDALHAIDMSADAGHPTPVVQLPSQPADSQCGAAGTARARLCRGKRRLVAHSHADGVRPEAGALWCRCSISLRPASSASRRARWPGSSAQWAAPGRMLALRLRSAEALPARLGSSAS
jgi:hypothetical protein